MSTTHPGVSAKEGMRVPDSECVNEPDYRQFKLTDQTNLLPFRKLIPVLIGLSLCIFVSNFDSVSTAAALPTISAHFHAGSVVSWAPSAYMLTSTSIQPLYGRFSDIFGRKAMLSLAMSIFLIGCLLSGFSRNFVELAVWRGIAGAGGGGILSLVQITISDVVSLRERGKYQGIILSVAAISYAIAPPIGGALSQKVSWRWCFWVTLPPTSVAMCMVIFTLPLKAVKGDIKKKLLAIDYVGAGLTFSSSTLILLPLVWGGVTFPWNSPVVITPLCAGILLLSIFCYWEWRGARLPIVPMYIFKHITISGVYIASFMNGFIFFSSVYYLPQFFEVALGYSAIPSGILLLPFLVAQCVFNWLAGVGVSVTGRYRMFVYSGYSIWAVACGCLSTVTEVTPRGLLVFYMLIAGVGMGQTLQTTTVAAQASVPRKDMSIVTALKNFVRQVGGTLSLAVASALVNNALRGALTSFSLSSSAIKTIIDNPALLGSHASSAQLESLGLNPTGAAYALSHGYMRGFRWLFMLNACLACVATLTSFFMIKHHELLRGDEERLKVEATQGLENECQMKKSPGESKMKGKSDTNVAAEDA